MRSYSPVRWSAQPYTEVDEIISSQTRIPMDHLAPSNRNRRCANLHTEQAASNGCCGVGISTGPGRGIGVVGGEAFVEEQWSEADNEEKIESWYQCAAAAGKTGAMFSLGHLCQQQEDLDGAESWWRPGAEAAGTLYMVAPASLLKRRARSPSASPGTGALPMRESRRRWICSAGCCSTAMTSPKANPGCSGAVESGHHPYATESLGDLCRDRGDLVGAETWWRRAVQPGPAEYHLGHVSAMYRLGSLLSDRGELKDAEAWLEKASGYNSKQAMARLAELLPRAW